MILTVKGKPYLLVEVNSHQVPLLGLSAAEERPEEQRKCSRPGSDSVRHTHTQRQKYLMPLLQSDSFLWGEIKDLQVRSKSQKVVFNAVSSPGSICLCLCLARGSFQLPCPSLSSTADVAERRHFQRLVLNKEFNPG